MFAAELARAIGRRWRQRARQRGRAASDSGDRERSAGAPGQFAGGGGKFQTAAVHALAHPINQALGNVGKTVEYTAPIEFQAADPVESLQQLVGAMNAGQVETLLVLGCNPVYDAPADFGFLEA